MKKITDNMVVWDEKDEKKQITDDMVVWDLVPVYSTPWDVPVKMQKRRADIKKKIRIIRYLRF